LRFLALGDGGVRGKRAVVVGVVAVLVVIVVIAAVFLIKNGDRGHTSASTTDTEPFTGSYRADFGPEIDLTTGQQVNDKTTTGTYNVRSLCRSSGCVAVAKSNGGPTLQPDLAFDEVRGRWLAVGVLPRTSAPLKLDNCRYDVPGDIWEVFTLQPKADGSFSGEYTVTGSNNCNYVRSVALTPVRDVAKNAVADPALLVPRVGSAPEGLYGRYTFTSSFANGEKASGTDLVVQTSCVRTADRCISFFYSAKGTRTGIPLVFAGGRWVWNEEGDNTCGGDGAMQHTKVTAEFPLPQPRQNPITVLSGHGTVEAPDPCANGDFDGTFERTGD
jgi:hypothetical protein